MIGLNPYWWTPNINRAVNVPRIGLFKLSTNAILIEDGYISLGVDPYLFKALPNESIVLLFINYEIPEESNTLPIAIVVPSNTSTLTNNSKRPVIDSIGKAVTGADIQKNSQKLMYINKNEGVMRIMEIIN